MNKIGVLASILIAFAVVGCTNTQSIITQKETGVFLIMNQSTNPADNSPDGAIGTGFFIDDNQIITNAHVVAKIKPDDINQKLSVKLENGNTYEVEVANIDTDVDLAILKIKDWDNACEVTENISNP